MPESESTTEHDDNQPPELAEQLPPEIVDSLSEDQVAILEATFVRRSMFAGPLPHPDILAAYESIVPGAAEQILGQAERQTAHRIEMESTVVTSGVAAQRRGQWMAFVLGGGFIGLAVFAASKGQDVTAGTAPTLSCC